jgi:hypothetical protein
MQADLQIEAKMDYHIYLKGLRITDEELGGLRRSVTFR